MHERVKREKERQRKPVIWHTLRDINYMVLKLRTVQAQL